LFVLSFVTAVALVSKLRLAFRWFYESLRTDSEGKVMHKVMPLWAIKTMNPIK
jgi:hypothetical protein